jgi:hypothetical protein
MPMISLAKGTTLSILEFISFLFVQNYNQLFLKRKITNAEMPSLIRKTVEDGSEEEVKRIRNVSLYDLLC